MNRRSFLLTSGAAAAAPIPTSFNIIRPPDHISVHLEKESLPLERSSGRWTAADVEIVTQPRNGELPISLSAPRSAITRLRLRWNVALPIDWRFLGDHWERSYGDLEWRGHFPDRLMPWYFLATGGGLTRGWGVKTGASAVACWQADPGGITLWLDVRNGGSGVQLGARRLDAAAVVAVQGQPGESPLAAARRLCRAMCPHARLPSFPIYGGNNWYYTYGVNLSADDLLRDASLMSELAPATAENRPFMLLDMGWTAAGHGAGPIAHTGKRFPDMHALAAGMRQRGVRPGIWIRPLLTVAPPQVSWRLPAKHAPFPVLDPSLPDVLAHISGEIRLLRDWGFQLIKHDFTTFDLLGRWGFQMGPELTDSGWHFADRTRTTAEIIRALYAHLRQAAGDSLLIGCNTIGHLGAGLFEIQRIGDDTSGREWSRTRKMGVNTLAFRLAQHNTFFAADADCVPVTEAIPWDLTRQWLDLVTRSGTPLFVSADPAVLGEKERAAIKAAFALASRPQPGIEPLDWLNTTVPSRWRTSNGVLEYRWYTDQL